MKFKRNPNSKSTTAFDALPKSNIGIGIRVGQLGGRLGIKGNRGQASKHQMRSKMGMNKKKGLRN